jgi:hypothetical protein
MNRDELEILVYTHVNAKTDADDQAGETVSMRAIVLPHRDSWFNTADMIPERRAAE